MHYFVESLSASVRASFRLYKSLQVLICSISLDFPGSISDLSFSPLKAGFMVRWLLRSLQICSEALLE